MPLRDVVAAVGERGQLGNLTVSHSLHRGCLVGISEPGFLKAAIC